MEQAAGEHEHVAVPQRPLEQTVPAVHEPRHHRAVGDEHHLGRPGVRVGQDHTVHGQVGAGHGEALRVEAGEVGGRHHVHGRPEEVVGVARVVEPRGLEVGGHDAARALAEEAIHEELCFSLRRRGAQILKRAIVCRGKRQGTE